MKTTNDCNDGLTENKCLCRQLQLLLHQIDGLCQHYLTLPAVAWKMKRGSNYLSTLTRVYPTQESCH